MSDLKIFAKNVGPEALRQIHELADNPAFSDSKIRIMPDVHAGKGCVIGFTADLGDKVIPNIVGVDIGCGMLTCELGDIDIDYDKLDSVIRNHVPAGRAVNDKEIPFPLIDELYCKKKLKRIDRIKRSIGSLGGGNHFIEIDKGPNGDKYLIIHTGSRNLWKQVSEIYQQMAIDDIQGAGKLNIESKKLIELYKSTGRQNEIEKGLSDLKRKIHSENLDVPKELCYLTGEHRKMYLYDMLICQFFAMINRTEIAGVIYENMGWGYVQGSSFQTIHNYIDRDSNIVRKGAIAAREGEKLLIPINMRDGCIIGVGKSNDDWNQSAPHGAGRIMSRTKAKENISLEEFQKSMNGIYTSSVCESTIDESPMAYKPMADIINSTVDTIDIFDIIKPVYNFKASE